MSKLIKQPSAWIPLAMSTAALILVLGTISTVGINNSEDEGTAAHFFQLLLAGQLPFIAYFAIKWLPKKQKDASIILVLQVIACAIALTPIFILGL